MSDNFVNITSKRDMGIIYLSETKPVKVFYCLTEYTVFEINPYYKFHKQGLGYILISSMAASPSIPVPLTPSITIW